MSGQKSDFNETKTTVATFELPAVSKSMPPALIIRDRIKYVLDYVWTIPSQNMFSLWLDHDSKQTLRLHTGTTEDCDLLRMLISHARTNTEATATCLIVLRPPSIQE